jgi:hypothetical protein
MSKRGRPAVKKEVETSGKKKVKLEFDYSMN